MCVIMGTLLKGSPTTTLHAIGSHQISIAGVQHLRVHHKQMCVIIGALLKGSPTTTLHAIGSHKISVAGVQHLRVHHK